MDYNIKLLNPPKVFVYLSNFQVLLAKITFFLVKITFFRQYFHNLPENEGGKSLDLQLVVIIQVKLKFFIQKGKYLIKAQV